MLNNSKIMQIKFQTISKTIAFFILKILKLLLLCMAFLKPTFLRVIEKIVVKLYKLDISEMSVFSYNLT